MTDNEIIKAVECCLAKENCEVISCEKCPLEKQYECMDIMFHQTLDLINRQKAEIEKYKSGMIANAEVVKTLINELKTAKSEAIKEFAERLKRERLVDRGYEILHEGTIGNLVKEMTGVD